MSGKVLRPRFWGWKWLSSTVMGLPGIFLHPFCKKTTPMSTRDGSLKGLLGGVGFLLRGGGWKCKFYFYWRAQIFSDISNLDPPEHQHNMIEVHSSERTMTNFGHESFLRTYAQYLRVPESAGFLFLTHTLHQTQETISRKCPKSGTFLFFLRESSGCAQFWWYSLLKLTGPLCFE